MPLGYSLPQVAAKYHFRPQGPNEPESTYRELLAQRIDGFDRIEAYEVRFNKMWNEWSETQKAEAFGL